MNKFRNTDKDIHQRIYRFIVGCFKDIVRKIPKATENLSVIGQISSSLTYMGANDQEADASGSTRDFLAKYAIVKKETKETIYWLTFICDAGLLTDSNINYYIKEGEEILKIVCTIIKNSKH